MGNGISGDNTDLQDTFFADLGGWCTGAARKENKNSAASSKRTSLPKSLSEEELMKDSEEDTKRIEARYNNLRLNSSSSPSPRAQNPNPQLDPTTVTTPTGSRTTPGPKKSSAQLVTVGMNDGASKQRYLTHASLDDAFAEGLIDADDYAQKLRRLDSLRNYEEEQNQKQLQAIEPIPMPKVEEEEK